MTDEQYQARVMIDCLRAILDIRGDGTGEGGYIDPEAAVNGLCNLIAALMSEAGKAGSLRDRRQTADFVRARVIAAWKHFDRMKAEGQALPWAGTMVPVQ